jgi:uncharacterized LabA/DUF88 family protein
MVKRKGWEIEVFDRNVQGKEKKVDTAITHHMTKDAYTRIDRRKSEITLVSGDSDYVPAVEDLVKDGFTVSVAFWGHAAKELRQVASSFFDLDPHVDFVGRRRGS